MKDLGFTRALGTSDREALAVSTTLVVAIDSRLRIRWWNRAWSDRLRLASRSAEDWLGRSITDAVDPELRKAQEELIRSVLQSEDAVSAEYECDGRARCRPSPADAPVRASDRSGRRWHLRFLPLAGGDGALVLHSPVVELDGQASDVLLAYDCRSFVKLCSYCHRTYHHGDQRWDWIPALTESDRRSDLGVWATHGLCKDCLVYYFGA
jgi:hypothetical protein